MLQRQQASRKKTEKRGEMAHFYLPDNQYSKALPFFSSSYPLLTLLGNGWPTGKFEYGMAMII